MSEQQKKYSLCAVIPTKDNIRTIRECLDSVKAVTNDIIVVDSGSTDGTIDLCVQYGAKVVRRPWPGMVKQRQFCLEQAKDYDWILVLDSDESLDETLQNSIKDLTEKTIDPNIEAFTFNRKVWFLGGWLHHVFQPEHRLRVVRGGVATVKGVGVDGLGGHDQLIVNGNVAHLPGTCKHDSWQDLDDMLRSYIRLGRRAAQYDPKPSKPYMILLNPLLAFIKQYCFKKGYKDGWRGFIASAGVACGNMIKQLQKNEYRGTTK
ncbi:glycosyltransferase family 2 protein [Methylomarinum sp. Ch1-1]|uniref:Glycosyltransferase family 2 protein n=1 Tax=Methylomarinum roseum TaxID=3067653 RepID=A0AAU7NVN4_9GAMM